MLAADLQGRMAEACTALERAGELLVRPSPENLEDCRVALGTAQAALEECTSELQAHAGDPALLAQALRLRLAVRRAGWLHRTAAEHHRKWFQILRAKLGGYTALGSPAEISGVARVWLQG
ncbi:MAG: hypothetical protein P4L56_10690 [Candidatus Sulfopaludibacter sp.]|nr:hypothetical protein [Candidatus Sulfopaludibacter sp.]